MQKKKGTGNTSGNNRNTSYYKSRINKKLKDTTARDFFDKSKKRQMSSYIRAVTVVFIFMIIFTGFIFLGIWLKNLVEEDNKVNKVNNDNNKTTAAAASDNTAVSAAPQIQNPPEDSLTNISANIAESVPDTQSAADSIPDIYGKFNGVYLDIQKLENLDSLQTFIDRIKTEGINAVNIDIKKEDGNIPFHISGQFDAVVDPKEVIDIDIRDIIDMLHKNGIYVSGTVVCFKDHMAATTFQMYPLNEVATNRHWTDGSGSEWLNVYSEGARNYIKDLVGASVNLGFDEIILSYFYLPNVSNPAAIKYEDGGIGKTVIVRNFITDIIIMIGDMSPKVKLGLDIKINDFLNMPNKTMGLDPDDLISKCNFFTTSFAPSDFPPGALNISKPEKNPYDTVKALCKHFKYLTDVAAFRPKIQAAGADMVTSQKQALFEAGISVWELVGSENIY